MKSKMFACAVIAALFVTVFISCASFPAPTSENDTALLIPVVYMQQDNGTPFGHYRVRLLNVATRNDAYIDLFFNSEYGLVCGLTPGDYSIVETEFKYDSGATGTVDKKDILFKLESKKITILDKAFVLKIAQSKNTTVMFTMWGFFDPLTQSVAKDLILRMSKDSNFNEWQLSAATLANESISQAISEVPGIRGTISTKPDPRHEFFELVKNGLPEQVQAAISEGVDAVTGDNDGMTPLMLAAWHNPNPEVIGTLLQAGAKVDEPHPKKGATASMFAACHNANLEIISTLVKAGANVGDRDKNGESHLMYAAWGNKNPEIISFLLQSGAAIDERDKDGWTALMYAAEHTENPAVISILLEAGARGSLKSGEGKTAFDYAEKNQKLKGTKEYWALNSARYKE